MRELSIKGTYNLRDLGGLPTESGQAVKPKMLLRSGNLDRVPQNSQKQLIDYGVKTIIDLRDEWEVDLYPNVFANSDLVTYHNLPLIGDALSHDAGWQRASYDYVELHDLYIKYVDHCQNQIGAIISTVAEGDSGMLIHCYAGKDRTGIITALLLAIVGVLDEMIASDYSLSYANIQHLVQEWRDYAIQNGRDLEQLARDAGSLPETIFQLLRHIRDKYDSVRQYLNVCGVSDKQVEQLHHKFTQ